MNALNIQTIALDDEPPALQLLEAYCGKTDFISLQKTFTSPAEALKYLHKYPVDLLFLDIQMPGMLGTEFRKKINPDIMVIFTTAYSNYAVDGFNLNVVDFLLKPYSLDRFTQAAEKARQYFTTLHKRAASDQPYIFLRADYSLVKIPLNDLLYIEGLEDYSKFHFASEPPMVIRITMKGLMEKLPANQFIRVHRSYIVRIDKSQKLRGNTILVSGKEINIGRVYKNEVVEIFKKLGLQ